MTNKSTIQSNILANIKAGRITEVTRLVHTALMRKVATALPEIKKEVSKKMFSEDCGKPHEKDEELDEAAPKMRTPTRNTASSWKSAKSFTFDGVSYELRSTGPSSHFVVMQNYVSPRFFINKSEAHTDAKKAIKGK